MLNMALAPQQPMHQADLNEQCLKWLYCLADINQCCACDAGSFSPTLDPQADFSCLAMVLNMALAPQQPKQPPLLYEQCVILSLSVSGAAVLLS